jgi:hypothetical protein
MRVNRILALALLGIIVASVTMPLSAADTLVATDFKLGSWAKVVDYFDYSRAFATLHNLTGPPADNHAYVYMTYVNGSGLQMLYAGMCNITLGQNAYLTIPMQTFLMHYKSENNSRDVLTSSNFVMLLAFNDTAQSLFPDSPDMNDNLWSSFSLGFNFSNSFPNATFPSMDTETEIFPLTNSSNGLQWSWRMSYKNLTAVWWATSISPGNQTFGSWPVALTTYDELMFNYTLTISPDTHSATLTENHVIGRIRDLWQFWGWLFVPLYNHYNSTGCYRYGNKISDETVYDFIQNNEIKMSIVDFQTSIVVDHEDVEHETYSNTAQGQNATDNEDLVSNSSITTYTDDGERIFSTSFGVKETYKLYNYTADQSETTSDTYNATTRTSKINGFAEDTALFLYHVGFTKFLPWLVYDMHPQIYDKAKDIIANMTRANYFYIIAYPVYSGYRIEHDPVFTAYVNPESIPEFETSLILPLFMAVTAFAVVYMKKRRVNKARNSFQP